MLPPLADINDFAAWLGQPLIDVDVARAEACLVHASTIVRAVAGVTWMTTNDDEEAVLGSVPDIVVTVTLAAARRAFLNPEGYRQETADGHTVTLPGDGTVYLTGEERELVVGALPSQVPGLSSVRVEAPRYAAGVPARTEWWCELEDDDE